MSQPPTHLRVVPSALDEPRRKQLLEAAIAVFARFGYRKSSMDEVARTANFSRQGLYLHFKTKDELFLSALEHAMRSSLDAAFLGLCNAELPLERRLVQAFDGWMGRFVGTKSADATDLVEASHTLAGPILDEHEALFREALAKTLRSAGIVQAYKHAGLSARDLAETLYATARGLKVGAKSRPEFLAGMSLAARALCAPLVEARPRAREPRNEARPRAREPKKESP